MCNTHLWYFRWWSELIRLITGLNARPWDLLQSERKFYQVFGINTLSFSWCNNLIFSESGALFKDITLCSILYSLLPWGLILLFGQKGCLATASISCHSARFLRWFCKLFEMFFLCESGLCCENTGTFCSVWIQWVFHCVLYAAI